MLISNQSQLESKLSLAFHTELNLAQQKAFLGAVLAGRPTLVNT